MPNVGLVRLRDSESGEIVTLDTSSRRVREAYAGLAREHADRRDSVFRRLRLDPIRIYTGEDFIEPLTRFFHRRENRR